MNQKKYSIIEIIKNIIIILFIFHLPFTLYLFFKKTNIVVDKNTSKALIYFVSDNLISSIIGALIGAITGGLFALTIAILNNYWQQKNSDAQISKQEEHAEILLNKQIDLSEKHFKNQQKMEFKKIEIDFYLENLDTLKDNILELKQLINYKISPLTKKMAKSQEELKNHKNEDYFNKSFETSLFETENNYNLYLEYIGRIHEISNEIETLSVIFDSNFSNHLKTLLEQHPTFDISGLIKFEGYLSEIWDPISKQVSEKEYSELTFYEVNYDIVVSHLMELILVLIQKTIPLERKNKIIELNNLITLNN